MTQYYVQIPIAGIIAASVQADNEEQATEKVQSLEWIVDFKSSSTDEGEILELEELDQYEEIVTGNVFHGPLNKIYVQKEK